MLARLGHEEPEPFEHLVAHRIGQAIERAVVAICVAPIRNVSRCRELSDGRVQVLDATALGRCELAAVFEVERHVVDAGALVAHVGDRDADVASQLLGGVLHAVAKADPLDVRLGRGGPCERPHVDRHRVDVLQECGVAAQLLHLGLHLQQHRHGSQAAHDAADAERVGDGLSKAELLGHLEVHDRRRLVTADLEHGDDMVRAIQRDASIGRGVDRRHRPDRRCGLAGDDLGGVEPLVVDVEQ